MNMGPLAGKSATSGMLVDVPVLLTAYCTEVPEASVQARRVAFGTSRHRGCAFQRTFDERHVLAISQAICEHRRRRGIDGPLSLGIDTANEVVDPTFRFLTIDWDGRIRMDPSSTYAVQSLIGLEDRFEVAFACDTDHDRHGSSPGTRACRRPTITFPSPSSTCFATVPVAAGRRRSARRWSAAG